MMGIGSWVLGLLIGLVPVIAIVRIAHARLTLLWVLIVITALILSVWMWYSLAFACRSGHCAATQPALLGLCGGLIVAAMIGGIRWLASRGKRPW